MWHEQGEEMKGVIRPIERNEKGLENRKITERNTEQCNRL